jgi:hypothetical protein
MISGRIWRRRCGECPVRPLEGRGTVLAQKNFLSRTRSDPGSTACAMVLNTLRCRWIPPLRPGQGSCDETRLSGFDPLHPPSVRFADTSPLKGEEGAMASQKLSPRLVWCPPPFTGGEAAEFDLGDRMNSRAPGNRAEGELQRRTAPLVLFKDTPPANGGRHLT